MKTYKRLKKSRKKNILLDMSCSLMHHGHIRLIKKASKYGNLIIALTSDKELKKHKKINPELNYKQRKEILQEIKGVFKIIPSKYELTQKFVDMNNIDILVQGSDYRKRKFKNKTITFSRTKNISSTILRKLVVKNIN